MENSQSKKENISHIKDCFGCGVCSASCPKYIIKMHLNKRGFYEPEIINNDKCIHCGICVDVCAFSHNRIALVNPQIKSWASWSNDEQIRRKCSSGGLGFEIGRQLIEKGFKVVGCRYSVEVQRAEHYIASTADELIQSIGSKYIQSFTEKAFGKINRKQKYLVTGTPCQIDSFRRMIRKFRCEDNFVLLDFFCHCVPSMYAWKAYIKMVEKKVGDITYASWRNKYEYGWHDSWLMGIDGVNTCRPVNWHDSYNLLIREKKTSYQSRMSQGDLFYKLFLGDVCLNKACMEQCKYKYNQSSADIRIGDLWGSTYEHDEKGVSALIAFTSKGAEVIENLENITLIEHSFETVAEGQMKENAHGYPLRPFYIDLLKSDLPLPVTCKIIDLLNIPTKIIRKIKHSI